jgi:AcrR family transcriptional regulator
MVSRRAPSTPRKRARREPEQARALILEAAIRVLSRNGPDAVGLKHVAAEAGVSHALVVHYFGSYEALVETTLLESAARLRARLAQGFAAQSDPSPEKVVLIYLDAVLEPWYGRLVSWALFSDHEGAASYAQRIAPEVKRIAAATHALIARQMKPAPTRRQVEALLVTVWSMAVGYVAGSSFFWRALGHKPGAARDRDLRKAVVELTRRMVGAGRR